MSSPEPLVSILLPNFNNGRQSSRSGRDDLIGDLLESLWRTLQDERTHFEIIAYDDGSTDDSLATLRNWSARRWPDGRPLLRLLEAPHCGYLSRVANELCRQAQGQILVRLDGDIVCLTSQWVSRLTKVFQDGSERLGIVGPKQLRPNGVIHAYGDFLLHPNGYVHVASGMPRQAVAHPLQVDHVMGCFHAARRELIEDVGGYDERFLRGQTEDLGLRAMLKGWTCLAVPNIEFVHAHMLRKERETKADSEEGIDHTLRLFERKWGFSRLAPDLDRVEELYAGTALLSNSQWFGPRKPVTAASVDLEESEWALYARDQAQRERINLRVRVTLEVAQQAQRAISVAALGVGQGLISHLLAGRGLSCLGFDDRRECLDLARRCTMDQKYPGERPILKWMQDIGHIPLGDGQVDLLVIYDWLERHPNPVALLRDTARVLLPGRILLIFSRRRATHGHDPSVPGWQAKQQDHPLMWMELLNLVQSTGNWEFLMDPKSDDPGRDMILAVRRLPDCASRHQVERLSRPDIEMCRGEDQGHLHGQGPNSQGLSPSLQWASCKS